MPWIFAIVLLVGAFALTALISPKQQIPKPSAMTDFQFPQADEGTPQPVYFGDCWTTGWFVLWYGNLRTQEIKQGGKK